MHLDPPEVTGYVLDAVATTSGAALDQFMFMTDTDANFGEVGDAFMALCADDSECNTHFKKKGLKVSVQELMVKLDKNPNSTCSQVVKMLKTDVGTRNRGQALVQVDIVHELLVRDQLGFYELCLVSHHLKTVFW
ncbi:hypothetical protein ON010_g1143 [Phytophthora cinnamomi]|nr:hypothetical protein ON010_g1143 [Phytophthora cinnamomi]